jgi:hypothetical protein
VHTGVIDQADENTARDAAEPALILVTLPDTASPRLDRRRVVAEAVHLSRRDSEVTSRRGESKYSRIRRELVFISAETAMPGVIVMRWPSTTSSGFSMVTVIGKTRFCRRLPFGLNGS